MQSGSLIMELIFDAIKSELNAINNGDVESACFPKSLSLIMQEFRKLTKNKHSQL